MTLGEAKEEIPTIGSLLKFLCYQCVANDWYCPSYCETLKKAQKMPFLKIQQAYARHDGDLQKLHKYIKQYRIR